MEDPDGRPPLPPIDIDAANLTPTRRRHLCVRSADIVRAAAGADDFGDIWLGDAVTDAVRDPALAALLLCDLGDLVVTMISLLAQREGVAFDDLLEQVTTRWVEQTT